MSEARRDTFEHYRVGGYVRDHLLGQTPKDTDYVVIGESPASMTERGFQQVGHFPVFLHPNTQEEYALARSERSTGDGYADFDYVWEGVTLEEDLKRRDLTINAMALDDNGQLIDPYGGLDDLKAGILRHVSQHFVEDPLRILRVARFAARYRFTVAQQTMELMTDMVQKGMLSSLSPERFWLETEKALHTTKPSLYFEVLDACGALREVFPELHALIGVPQRPDYHAEGDVWIHTRMVLDEAASLTLERSEASKLRVRVGALLHDLGKAYTPHDKLWDEAGNLLGKHHGHDEPEQFEAALNELAERIRMPSELRQFAHRCALSHQDIHRLRDMSGRGLVSLYDRMDLGRVLRHDKSFLDDLAMVCTADNSGRLYLKPDGSKAQPTRYRQAKWMIEAMTLLHQLPVGEWMREEMARRPSLDDAKQAVLGRRRTAANRYLKDLCDSLENG